MHDCSCPPRWFAAALLTLALTLTGCPPQNTTPGNGGAAVGPATGASSAVPNVPTAKTPLALVNVTADSGVKFQYEHGRDQNQSTVLELVGGGAGLVDYDGDGDLDLFLPGGGSFDAQPSVVGRPAGLFRQTAPFRFQEVTAPAHAQADRYYTHGCWWSDFDHDGFADALITGYGGVQLLHNCGDGTFAEIALEAGLEDPSWSVAAVWFDANQDGCLDLYLSHYVTWSFQNHPVCNSPDGSKRDACTPLMFDGIDDRLLISDGAGGFVDESKARGLQPAGKGLAIVAADLNLDGAVDLYVANDGTDNFQYMNDGQGKFVEEASRRGTACGDLGLATASMGVSLCDYNADGWPDFGMGNFVNEKFGLYQNIGDGFFQFGTQRAGLGVMGERHVTWGVNFADFDLDGGEDLLVTNGHAYYYADTAPFKQPSLLFRLNRETKRFEPVVQADPFWNQPHAARGAAVGDIDNDGRTDVVISQIEEPVVLLQNQTVAPHRSLSVRLIGRASTRDPLAARVTLQTAGRKDARHLAGGGGYCSQSDLRLLFHTAVDDPPQSLWIHWPSGVEQTVEISADETALVLIEPDAATNDAAAGLPGSEASPAASPEEG